MIRFLETFQKISLAILVAVSLFSLLSGYSETSSSFGGLSVYADELDINNLPNLDPPLKDPATNRLYKNYSNNGINCKIFVQANQGAKTKNGLDITGRSCTDSANQDASKRCVAINANFTTEPGGAENIQLSCNPSTFAFRDNSGVTTWGFNNDATGKPQTYAISDKDGNILTMSIVQIKSVCGDVFQPGNAGAAVGCNNVASFADFQTQIQQKVCNQANQNVNGRTPFSQQCANFTAASIAKGPSDITGDVSQAQASKDTANQSDNLGDIAGKGVFALFRAILDLISAILLVIAYILGWVAIGLMFLISNVFITLIQINPAGGDFINVALEPWKIVYGIANLLTLAAFLYVGFSYILGRKVRKIEDFITNIIIITVALNFTFFASATFVNIAHGIGDLFIGSFTTAQGKQPGDIVGGIVDGIETVSIIRCGNVQPDGAAAGEQAQSGGQQASSTPAAASDCDTNAVGEVLRLGLAVGSGAGGVTPSGFVINLLGGWAGYATSALIAEVAFLVIMGWAIYVMGRAVITALFRVVGLWLLMIASPFALAAFFSPIPGLKKVADQWVNKFFYLSVFYPAFILGLILVSVLASTFGSAAKNNITNIGSGSTINAYAQNASAGDIFTLLIGIVLTAAVSIGSLQFLLRFLDKELESLAGAVWDWTKKSLAFTGGSIAGLGRFGGAIGNTLANRQQGQIDASKFTMSQILKNRKAGLMSAGEARQAFNLEKERLQAAQSRQSAFANFGKGFESSLVGVGKKIRVAPVYAETLAKMPKTYMDNLDRTLQADYAEEGKRFKGRLEVLAKTNPVVRNALEGIGYDFKSSKDRVFNAETLEQLQAEAREVNKPLNEYLNEQIEANASKARSDSLGVNLQPASYAVQSSLFRNILKKAGGSLQNLSSQDIDKMTEIMVNATDDDSGSLAQRIFSSRESRDFVRNAVSSGQIQDSKVLAGISKRLPNLLSEEDQYNAGLEAANDERRANAIFRVAFDTSERLQQGVIDGTLRSGRKISDAYKIIGQGAQKGYSTSSITAGRGEFKNSEFYKGVLDSIPDPKQRETFAKQVDLLTGSSAIEGVTSRTELVSQQAEALLEMQRRNGSVSEQAYQDSARDALVNSLRSEFGSGVGNSILAGDVSDALQNISSANISDLENTDIGKRVKRSQDYATASDEEKARIMRAVFAQTAFIADQNRLEGGENAYRKKLEETIRQTSQAYVEVDKRAALKQQQADALAQARAQIKSGQASVEQVLSPENVGLSKVLGSNALLDYARRELAQGGTVQVNQEQFSFAGLKGEKARKLAGDLNQLLALTNSPDQEIQDTATARITALANDYADDEETQRFIQYISNPYNRNGAITELGRQEIESILNASRKGGSVQRGAVEANLAKAEDRSTSEVRSAYDEAFRTISQIDVPTFKQASQRQKTIRANATPATPATVQP